MSTKTTAITKPKLTEAMQEAFREIDFPEQTLRTPFQEWFMGLNAGFDAEHKRVTEGAEQILRYIRNCQLKLHYIHGAQFQQMVRQDIERQPGTKKSYRYLQGVAGTRAKKQRLVIEDERAVISWAHTNCPDALRTTISVRLTPLSEHLAATGELPPGCGLIDAHDAFYPNVEFPELEDKRHHEDS